MDGLRPDAITSERMPHVAAFASEARWFKNATSVFPSMTRVATTSIATGVLPRHHGVVGNAVWLPEIAKDRILDLGRFEDVRLAEKALDGRLVDAETFADRMASQGVSVAMVSTSNAGTARFLNPRADRNDQLFLATASSEASTPHNAHRAMIERFGPVPSRGLPSTELITYATRVFCEQILQEACPDVAALWFCEPDVTYHYAGLHTLQADAALDCLDQCFARIVSELPDDCTVLLASDHGHLTIDRHSLVLSDLVDMGFPIPDWRVSALENGDIKAAAWTSGALWLPETGAFGQELSDALHAHPDVSVVLARDSWGDAISLEAVGLDHVRAPDVAFCLASSNDDGGNGAVAAGGDVPIGGGMHGGLSRAEMMVTMIARGPGFAVGDSGAPVSICDISASLEHAAGIADEHSGEGIALQDAESTVESDRVDPRVSGLRFPSAASR